MHGKKIQHWNDFNSYSIKNTKRISINTWRILIPLYTERVFKKNWIIKNKLKCIIKKKNWIILKAVNPECACKGQYF